MIGRRFSPAKVLVVGFFIIILVGSFLLSMPIAVREGRISYIDALFTATSAVCVTGLVIHDTGSFFTPFGQFVIMILIFIGSLGFMTIVTLLFMLLGKKVMLKDRLVLLESLNRDNFGELNALVLKIISVVLLFKLVGALVLSIYFIPALGLKNGLFYAVFHSVSAFGNAGFDLVGGLNNLYNNYLVTWTIMVLFILGGLGFIVIIELIHVRSHGKLSLHTKLVLAITLILLLVSWPLIWLLENNNPATLGSLSFLERSNLSLFTAATPRTAGFHVISTAAMQPATLFFIMVLMFIGASPGSTGGGIKTTTFGLLCLAVIAALKGRDEPSIMSRKIPFNLILRTIAVISSALALVLLAVFILALSEKDVVFISILFEAVSAFSNVGMSTGITPDLTSVGKLVIIILMFAGRLGPVILFMALSSQKSPTGINYPYEKVMIG